MHLIADSVTGNIPRGVVIMKRKQNTDKTCCLYCTSLAQQCDTEQQCWKEVLRCVVAVTKFLGARGLPFQGDNELLISAHNGNYLGLLELIVEFDPFLKEHLEISETP